MDGTAIETTRLGKVYPGPVRALDEVSLRTAYGEVFAYLGRNGSGKTTTIRILTTLTAATTGTARVAGHDVAHRPEAVRRAIGVTMQHAALDDVARHLLHEVEQDPSHAPGLDVVGEPRHAVRNGHHAIEVAGLAH